jgi:hypothetical protein
MSGLWRIAADCLRRVGIFLRLERYALVMISITSGENAASERFFILQPSRRPDR